ncbi:MAG: hypothetical protein QOJ63_1335, partial [Solirubrobacteraceae bacterium]|nr:hypothetical protein [Solirubrobacteraceae bacterium]
SSACATIRLLGIGRAGARLRVRVRTACEGLLALKATASVVVRHRHASVVVRSRGRPVGAGVRTVVLSFAGSQAVGRALRDRRRAPVALLVTFVPRTGGPTQVLRRPLLLLAPPRR